MRQPDLAPPLRTLYEDRGWRALWTDDDGLTRRGRALRDALAAAGRHGLDPARYAVPESLDDGAMELALSRAAGRLGQDLRDGVLDTQHADHVAYAADTDMATVLRLVAYAASPDEALAGPATHSPLYGDLVKALARYRSVAAAGGWPQVPDGPTIEIGEADPVVIPALRRRLLISGDLGLEQADDLDAAPFDLSMDTALRRFQERHGLAVDGVLGPRTRAALNVPVEDRIRAILLNLDRLRWMPDDLGARHIMVNIAGFEVMVFEDGRPTLRSPVVVGKDDRQTPAFSDVAEHVVFNPYWNVPQSIAVEEIAPRAAADPDHIFRQNMEVLTSDGTAINPWFVDWQAAAQGAMPYRLRQRPGSGNALGKIKILFPNDFAVYLHDTPAKSLFNRRVRAFSHGCVRVQKPFDLAAAVLGWPVEEVLEKVRSQDRAWVNVESPMPVHVAYLTAWVDPDSGAMQFRDDIYGRDADLWPQVASLPTL